MFDSIRLYETFINRVNPLSKILMATLLFVTVLLIHNPNTLLYFLLFNLIFLIILSGIKPQYILALLGAIFISGILSSTYMILYGQGDTTLYRLGIIHISQESLIRGIHVAMRGVILSLFGALIIFTTRITDIFYALMIHLKLPPKYAYSFMAAIRMVPLIISEYMQLRQAKKVRAPLINKKYVTGFAAVKSTIITLLSQSIRRSYRLSIAMESKGFSNNKRSFYRETSFSRLDLYFFLLLLISLLISIHLSQHYFIFNTNDARSI